jgi:hypothetical protein
MVDIDLALGQCDALVVSTCGENTPGETYGLVMAQAIRCAVPVIHFGQPIGLLELIEPSWPHPWRVGGTAEAVAVLLRLAVQRHKAGDPARAAQQRSDLELLARNFSAAEQHLWQVGIDTIIRLLPRRN